MPGDPTYLSQSISSVIETLGRSMGPEERRGCCSMTAERWSLIVSGESRLTLDELDSLCAYLSVAPAEVVRDALDHPMAVAMAD